MNCSISPSHSFLCTNFFVLPRMRLPFSTLALIFFTVYGCYKIPVFILSALFANKPFLPHFEYILFLQFPGMFFIHYCLMKKVFKFSTMRSVYLLQNFYQDLYILLLALLLLFDFFYKVERLSFSLSLLYARLCCLPLLLVECYIDTKMVRNLKLNTNFHRPATVSRSSKKWVVIGCGFATVFCTYLVTSLFLLWMADNTFYRYVIGISALVFLIITHYMMYTIDVLFHTKENMRLKEAYIASLVRSIDDYRGIKHDFGNLLQIYSGYLLMEQYDELRIYHNDVLRRIGDVQGNLESLQQIETNPLILGLVLAKKRDADATAVNFHFSSAYTDDLPATQTVEFGRILGNLLDNALEEAAQSSQRLVRLSLERIPGERQVTVVLTNSTDKEVNVSAIFAKGYTTKLQHSGQGLWEISKILAQSERYALHCSYQNRTFTAFLKVLA